MSRATDSGPTKQQEETNNGTPIGMENRWSEVSNYLWKQRVWMTEMQDYQTVPRDRPLESEGLPMRLIAEMKSRADLVVGVRSRLH